METVCVCEGRDRLDFYFLLRGVDGCKLEFLGRFACKYLWNEKDVYNKRFSPGNCYSPCHSKGLTVGEAPYKSSGIPGFLEEIRDKGDELHSWLVSSPS